MKKNEIIKNSLELFLEKGYEKTTISDIMKKTGLSKGGMYHHFSSKEDILDAVIIKAFEEENFEFESKLDDLDDLIDKLILIFHTHSSPSEYLQKFYSFTGSPKKSIVYYKVREFKTEYGTNALKKVFMQGIDKGVLKIEYPQELSSLLYYYGQDIIYRAMAAENREAFLLKEFKTFSSIVRINLGMTEEFEYEFYHKLKTLVQQRG